MPTLSSLPFLTLEFLENPTSLIERDVVERDLFRQVQFKEMPLKEISLKEKYGSLLLAIGVVIEVMVY
jgi:hypothetical protein